MHARCIHTYIHTCMHACIRVYMMSFWDRRTTTSTGADDRDDGDVDESDVGNDLVMALDVH